MGIEKEETWTTDYTTDYRQTILQTDYSTVAILPQEVSLERWIYPTGHYPLSVTLRLIEDREWQTFRHSLKGLPTWEKLDRLEHRLNTQMQTDKDGTWIAHIQVTNYIYALRRGRFLNANMEVMK